MIAPYTTHYYQFHYSFKIFRRFELAHIPRFNSSDSVDQILKTFVVVNFLSRVIFVFLLFLGMVMYANEVETKEK